MAAEDDTPPAANDNAAREKIERATLILARLLGRQIAREVFGRLQAANDDGPGPGPERADE